MILGLQPDLDEFHRRDDRHGFRHPSSQSGEEVDARSTVALSILIGQQLFIPVVTGEANGDLGDDSRHDGAQASVEAYHVLVLSDVHRRREDSSAWYAECVVSS